MNISIKTPLVFLVLLGSFHICAQTQIRAGFLPSVNYNHKIDNFYELNFRSETRHFVFSHNSIQNNNFEYDYSLTDFSAMVGRSAGLNSKLVLGALIRLEPGALAFRTIQQFIFQTKIENFRIAQRIATDQTFTANEAAEFRLRYRLSTEIPLQGLKVDVKEFYFKLNTEVLNSLQNNEYDLEFRAVPHLGYVVNDRHKIEVGLDNRVISFIYGETRFTSWLTINWFM